MISRCRALEQSVNSHPEWSIATVMSASTSAAAMAFRVWNAKRSHAQAYVDGALVDAFTGPRWRELYAEALAQNYRFLSFGDAMLCERRA